MFTHRSWTSCRTKLLLCSRNKATPSTIAYPSIVSGCRLKSKYIRRPGDKRPNKIYETRRRVAGLENRSSSQPNQLEEEKLQKLLNFRERLLSNDVGSTLRSLPAVIQDRLLEPADTIEISKQIHFQYRQKHLRDDDDLKKLANTFVKHIRSGEVPPSPRANLHMISYFKESKQYDAGIEFWNWTVQQDDQYVDLSTYGAAIELLASYGSSLAYCEEIYIHGLKRFPSNFNAYHLSPGAVLRDRSQHVDLKGTSLSLLQGIITARLVHGDWRKAYLALDTAFRIHPTQILNRMIDLFLYERPINEAYQVFMMACRSGNTVKGRMLTILMDLLATAQRYDGDYQWNLQIVNAMSSAFHAYIGSAGRFDNTAASTINTMLRIILTLFPNGVDLSPSGGTKKMEASDASRIWASIEKIFTAVGLKPSDVTLRMIASLGGRLQNEYLLLVAVEGIQRSDRQPEPDTLRVVMGSAGEVQSQEMVKACWDDLKKVIPSGGNLEKLIWRSFASAAAKTGLTSYVWAEFEEIGSTGGQATSIESVIQHEMDVQSTMSEEITPQPQTTPPADWSQQVWSSLDILREGLARKVSIHWRSDPVLQMSIWSSQRSAEEAWQQKLYDELTLDPNAPPAAFSGRSKDVENVQGPHVDQENEVTDDIVTGSRAHVRESPTGFPLDQLRYLNWKTMNEILSQAEVFEERLKLKVDLAIEQGQPVRQIRSKANVNKPKNEYKFMFDQIQAHRTDLEREAAKEESEDEWREKILRLRRNDEWEMTNE